MLFIGFKVFLVMSSIRDQGLLGGDAMSLIALTFRKTSPRGPDAHRCSLPERCRLAFHRSIAAMALLLFFVCPVSEPLSAEPLSTETKNKDPGNAKKQAEPER